MWSAPLKRLVAGRFRSDHDECGGTRPGLIVGTEEPCPPYGSARSAGFPTVPPAGRNVVAVIDNDIWMNIGISSGFQEFHATTHNGTHRFDGIQRWRG